MIVGVQPYRERGSTSYLFPVAAGEPLDNSQWLAQVWRKAPGADVTILLQMLGHKDATETVNTSERRIFPS